MPSLMCPDCGQPHALDSVGGSATFRCGGCGRVLKVPERFVAAPARRGASAGVRAEAPAPASPARSAEASGAGPEPGKERRTARASGSATAGAPGERRAAGPDRISRWVSLALWILAIPLGALLVFGAAQMLDLLSSRQLLDTFLRSGVDRFGAVARLLPFWALVSAAIVHFSHEAIQHACDRHRRASDARRVERAPQRRDEREPVRAGS